MRYYLDTEFNERGPDEPLELISLGIVSQNRRTFYAVAFDGFKLSHCSDWVADNVLPHLGGPWLTRWQISEGVRKLIGDDPNPEFWGYYADYDWVLFCQLFGRMIDLPKNFPMYCRDLKLLMDERGISKASLPEQKGAEHNALEDALWIQEAHLTILQGGTQG